ncbi:MAG: hypothetical protein LUE96_07590 [Lachnospiraceae bacterium]|nr:hypothetical protein [Lachnospiraceae bacterium]
MKKGAVSRLSAVAGAVAGAVTAGRMASKATNKAQIMSDKHLALYLLMNQWVAVKQEGKNLKDYFEENGYKTIAIYGMSYVGERLVEELRDSDINIKYAIDKSADSIYSAVKIVAMDEDLEDVDAIIVTPVFFFDEIEAKLMDKMQCPIISIEDVLYEV